MFVTNVSLRERLHIWPVLAKHKKIEGNTMNSKGIQITFDTAQQEGTRENSSTYAKAVFEFSPSMSLFERICWSHNSYNKQMCICVHT